MSKRAIIIPILVLGVAAVLLFSIKGYWTTWEGGGEQRTDDAYVRADMTPMSTRVSGSLSGEALVDWRLRATSAGKKHVLKQADLDKMLRHLSTNQNGEIRVMANLSLEGKIIGPFRYSGTRSDDPNDLVPHDQRRDLRGLAVLCAWLNHTDAKADNSMDTVVGKGADARIRHNLLDFGAAFGSDSDIAKDPRHGQEFFLPTSKAQLNKVYTLGLLPNDWERVHYPHDLPAAGNITQVAFHPASWKPNYPNQAFLRMTPEDAYWGAKLVMAFSDEDIQAIVEEGKFTDPRVTKYVTTVLEKRRDTVGSYWFNVILPLEHVGIDNGAFLYDDLAQRYNVGARPRQLHFTWFDWKNDVSKQGAIIAESSTASVPRIAKRS